MKARARAMGLDIIDFGMGNPDSPSPTHVVEKLVEAVRDPRTHRYSTSRGIKGLRRALAEYYQRRFGVHLDPLRARLQISKIPLSEGWIITGLVISNCGDGSLF